MVSPIDFAVVWGNWIGLAGVLLMIGVILVGIVYIISVFISNDKFKSWAKSELVELLYSAVLISLLVFGSYAADGILQGAMGIGAAHLATGGIVSPTTAPVPVVPLSGGSSSRVYTNLDICGPNLAAATGSVYSGIPSCHIKLAIWYLRELYDEAKQTGFEIYSSYIATSMIAEFTLNVEFIFEITGFFNFNPFKGFFAMGNYAKSTLFDWAIKLMMLNKFQEVIIRYIATGLYPTFFVMGAILRAFSFTRKLGGLLLAIALSLYFILPSFYAFAALLAIDLKAHVRSAAILNDNPQAILGDPPIASTMYVDGYLPLLSNRVTAAELHNSLRQMEGVTDEEFLNRMERGYWDNPGTVINPGNNYDFSSNSGAALSDDQRRATIATAHDTTQNWFNSISRLSRLDQFVSHIWEPGGYIESFSRLTFWSMFFSLLGLLATIAGIRSLAIIFGGDIEIAGLTRLI
ncbi:hypothetical protein HY990_06550 [Candidatus Micrarchaeota archaeon]|nr:hypothetical protein [Candidatus Micrarchaeota archaeon]